MERVQITVDAIAKYENGIVIIDRKRTPFGLAMPGGKLDKKETLENAMHRELFEETGLKISKLEQFRTYSEPDRDTRGDYRWISTVFICEAYGKLNPGSDAKGARIIQLNEIDSLKEKFAFDHYKILSDYKNSI